MDNNRRLGSRKIHLSKPQYFNLGSFQPLTGSGDRCQGFRDANRKMPRDDRAPTLPRDDRAPTLFRDDRVPTLSRDDRAPTLFRDDRAPTLFREDRAPTLFRDDRAPTLSIIYLFKYGQVL